MGTLALWTLVAALIVYAVAATLFVGHLISKRRPLGRSGLTGLSVAMSLHAVGKVMRFIDLGHVPVTNSIEAMNVLALGIAIVFVYVARRYSVPAIGAFVTPLAFVTLAASLAFAPDQTGAVPAALQSAWFPVHLGFSIAADALFLVAGITAVAFLVQERFLRIKQLGHTFRKLPPLHVLDEVTHRLIVLGWLLMTAGMVAGAFFAKQKWGAYWSWDPRQTWSLFTWLIFAAILHARLTVGWQGRRAAWLTLLACVSVLLALVGLDVVTTTRHGGEYL